MLLGKSKQKLPFSNSLSHGTYKAKVSSQDIQGALDARPGEAFAHHRYDSKKLFPKITAACILLRTEAETPMTINLKDKLNHEHQRHKELFDMLLNRVHVGDTEGSQSAWTDFERALSGHLELEEEHILPLFERQDEQEAKALREEHEKIRSLAAELGVGLDIHTVREDKIKEFIQFIESHAQREDQLMYRWAAEELPDPERHTLLDRIVDAIQTGVDVIKTVAGENKIL